ncbi:MAG: hypothetical protein ABI222_12475 [Opitutaceae bacterium]
MKKPPLTPEEKLKRILRTARMNGLSVVIIAGLGVLISIGDWFGMAVGAAIVYGGWTELGGRKQILAGHITGVRLLVRSQWIVLAAIEIYCAVKLGFDRNHGVSPELREAMVDLGIDMAALEPSLRLAFYGTYGAVAAITLIYQGGMARYYGRSSAVVKAALEARARPVVTRVNGAADPEDELT